MAKKIKINHVEPAKHQAQNVADPTTQMNAADSDYSTDSGVGRYPAKKKNNRKSQKNNHES